MSNDEKCFPKWKKIEDTASSQLRCRHGHKSVVYRDLLIIFGGGNDGIIDSLSVFNLINKKWIYPTVSGDIPAGCAAFGMALDEPNIIIFGGMLEYGFLSNMVYSLSVNNWEWTKLEPTISSGCNTPKARLGHSFTYIRNHKFIMFGGLANLTEDPLNNIPCYLDDLYLLDLSCEKPIWSCPPTYGPKPSARESHTCVYSEYTSPKLIYFGGMNGLRLAELYILELNSMTWSQPQMSGIIPQPRSLHSSVIIKNKMYVFGGWIPFDDNKSTGDPENDWRCTNTLFVYDIVSSEWYLIHDNGDTNSIPKARAGHCASVLDSRFYIWSGRDGYRKAWNNQVCCKGLWCLETERPFPPSKLQLVKATTHQIEIIWDYIPNADSYLLELSIPSTNIDLKSNEKWFVVGLYKTNTAVVNGYYVPNQTNINDPDDPTKLDLSPKISIEPGNNYYLRVSTINVCGSSEYSPVASFRTCQSGFPGAPCNIKISKSKQGALMSWDSAAHSGYISEYSVYLAVLQSNLESEINKLTTQITQVVFQRVYCGSSPSCSVSNEILSRAHLDNTLKPAIIFRISAKNDKGYGPATQVRWLQDSKEMESSLNKKKVGLDLSNTGEKRLKA